MKAKRLLFLVMAICLASGVKAQFYDGPDDIYYYVEVYHEKDEYVSTSLTSGYYTGRKIKEIPEERKAKVYIFNFDGLKAARLSSNFTYDYVEDIKSNLKSSPSYYEDKIETTEYDVKFVSSSSSGTKYEKGWNTYTFSNDRNTLRVVQTPTEGSHPCSWDFKRVDKSYFKVGRSRTPSGKMYE